MSDNIPKLVALFEHLPGIGPRQARRFVYALLDMDADVARELADGILQLRAEVSRCTECFRAFSGTGTVCSVCNIRGNSPTLLVVERDVDLENLDKLAVYDGLTFILGGTVSSLETDMRFVRLRELFDKVKRSPQITELIIATSATNEGDTTAAYITKIMEEFLKAGRLTITRLGRGLSTGTQLEFSDRATLEQAIKNRR
ncbi:MAG: recombination protein RecR [Candidatus Niyogibacteria bacterium]|nr:recombination protein RecR [Candidatus Niyogibacteria bacterium]